MQLAPGPVAVASGTVAEDSGSIDVGHADEPGEAVGPVPRRHGSEPADRAEHRRHGFGTPAAVRESIHPC